jgi:hypothetical protein
MPVMYGINNGERVPMAVTTEGKLEIMASLSKPTNYLYVGKNGNGTGGIGDPFLTVGAAIAAASSGTTIFIWPGTYTENITFKAGVNLTSPVTYGVYIIGNHTASFAGTIIVENIVLLSSTGITLSYSGATAQNLQFYNSSINSGSGDAINWTNTNASSKLQIIDGTVNVATSGTTARAFYSTTGALGSLIANRTTFKINNPNNVCLGIGGGISFTHTSDSVIGQIVVSNTASSTFALITMATTSVPVLITNSTGTSTISEVVALTTSTPCFSGAGVLVFLAIGYASTGVGGATTLNGGIGAIPLPMSPVRLRATALSTGISDGTFEYDGTNLYFSIGTTRTALTHN